MTLRHLFPEVLILLLSTIHSASPAPSRGSQHRHTILHHPGSLACSSFSTFRQSKGCCVSLTVKIPWFFNGKERALYFFVKLRHPCFSGFAPSIIVLMGLPHLEFRCSPNFNNDLYKWLSQWYWCKQELHNKHPFQSPACNVGTLAHSKEDEFLFICLWFFVWMQLIHCIFPDPVEESQKNKEKNFQPLANQGMVHIDGWVYPWRCREMRNLSCYVELALKKKPSTDITINSPSCSSTGIRFSHYYMCEIFKALLSNSLWNRKDTSNFSISLKESLFCCKKGLYSLAISQPLWSLWKRSPPSSLFFFSLSHLLISSL